jgi:DNA-binding XRE family transcriptional regulator
MSARTKTPPTDAQCTLAFMGPVAQAEAARETLQALGFRVVESDAHHKKTASHPHSASRAGCFLHGRLDVVAPRRRSPVVEDVDADISRPVPWREAFPPLDDTERPGRMLRAARTREDLTQMQLARLTGIPQRHLSAMEQGKRAIGKERATKLAEVLHVDYRLFL